MKMTPEVRELYCYTTSTEPFASAIKGAKVRQGNMINNIIADAREQYRIDYCPKGEDCFTDEESYKVLVAILSDKAKEIHEDDFTDLVLDDVVSINRALGNHWFDRNTMKFFGTQIKTDLLPNLCFVTGEYTGELGSKKHRYTIRRFNLDTLDIEDESEFLAYPSAVSAIKAAKLVGLADEQ